MHASATWVALLFGGRSNSRRWVGEVLDDGAVYGELVRWGGAGGGGFGDEGFEHGLLTDVLAKFGGV